MPYRLISFLAAYEALLASLSAGVYFHIRVAAGVTGRVYSVRVLLAVAAVRNVRNGSNGCACGLVFGCN